MAEYVWNSPNVLHVPGVIDPKGDPEKTTPGAIFAPGVPTELDDRDAERASVQNLIKSGQLRPAQAEDKARAAEIEAERKRENEEAAERAQSAAGRQPAGKR